MARIEYPNPYQSEANALPGEVVDAGTLFPDAVGSNFNANLLVPGAQVASRANRNMTVDEGHDPVRTFVYEKDWSAAERARAVEASQTLQLNGLSGFAYARPSGSAMRSFRVSRVPVQLSEDALQRSMPAMRGLGSAGSELAATIASLDVKGSCPKDDTAKLAAPVAGFFYSLKGKGVASGDAISQAVALFGKATMACVLARGGLAYFKAGDTVSKAIVEKLTGASPAVLADICAEALPKEDRARAEAAGARMAKLGEFSTTKWWLFSGYTPLYKNPLAWTLGAVTGFVGYRVAKKRRWIR